MATPTFGHGRPKIIEPISKYQNQVKLSIRFCGKKTKNQVTREAISIINHSHLNLIKSKFSFPEFVLIRKVETNFSIRSFGKIDQNWNKNVHFSFLYYVNRRATRKFSRQGRFCGIRAL